MDHEPGLLRWGVAEQAIIAAGVSGDQYLVRFFPRGALVAVVDGLGHGENAALAAQAAVATLAEAAQQPVADLMNLCHAALRRTRGAVVSLAAFTAPLPPAADSAWTMTWWGVGNVKGVLLRADPQAEAPREWLVARGGVVGYNLPTPRPVTLSVAAGDTLIFVTDGIHSHFAEGLAPPALQAGAEQVQALADRIMAQSRRGTDDALVLVAQCQMSPPDQPG